MTFFKFDKIAQITVLFGALLLASCGDHTNDSGSPDAPVYKTKPLIGYGLPNAWQLDENDPVVLADALDAAGAGLTIIEWAPAWGSPVDPRCHDGSTSQTYPEKAATFVDVMRSRNIWTNIVIVNANGCAQRNQPDDYVVQAIKDVVDYVGTDMVLLTIVSEPIAYSEKAEQWTRLGAQHWPGLLVIPDIAQNHRTGRPFIEGLKASLIDVHYCNDDQLIADLKSPDPHVLHNTDCGLIVNPGEARAERFAELAAKGNSPHVIYDFHGKTYDLVVIAAIGRGIQKGQQEQEVVAS